MFLNRHLHRSRHMLLSAQKWKVRVVFWSSAVVIGAVAAGFAEGAEYSNQLFRQIIHVSPLIPLVFCPAVLLVVAWLTRRLFPGSEGSGIPQAIAALSMPDDAARSKVLSIRIAFGKILLTLLGLISGASIGREGPTVHIGASVLYSIRRLAPFPRHDIERGLILAGGAAGISAAFNTPIAGILFAIEEMSRSFEERSSGTVIIAVVVSGLIALVILGDYTYFGTTDAQLGDISTWLAVPVCGIAGGALGGLFSQALILGTERMPAIFRKRPYLLALACGLAIAVIGLISGGATYGTGYDQAKAVVTGTGSIDPMYPIWKLLATVVSYLSGIPGGIFAPSLATGAGLGANLASWFPSAPAAAIVILAMVSYFSGVVQTPITAFVIVSEMTGNQAMLLPLMAASFIAYGTSTIICPKPVYRALAKAFHQKQQEPVPVPPPDTDQRSG